MYIVQLSSHISAIVNVPRCSCYARFRIEAYSLVMSCCGYLVVSHVLVNTSLFQASRSMIGEQTAFGEGGPLTWLVILSRALKPR